MEHALDQYLTQQDNAYADKFGPDEDLFNHTAIVRKVYGHTTDLDAFVAESLERQRVLTRWIERHYAVIAAEFGENVWRAFWYQHIVAQKADGDYVLSLDDQRRILNLVDRVGATKFMETFVAVDGELEAAVAAFAEVG